MMLHTRVVDLTSDVTVTGHGSALLQQPHPPVRFPGPVIQHFLTHFPGWLPVPPPCCSKIHQESAHTPDHTLFGDRHSFSDHLTLVLRSLTGLVNTQPNLSKGRRPRRLKSHVDSLWRWRCFRSRLAFRRCPQTWPSRHQSHQ